MNRLIFGCGYLGARVATRWQQAGDKVYALTRSPDHAESLKLAGLHPIVGDITRPQSISDLPPVESVLFAVGMDRTQYSDIRTVYVDGLRNVLHELGKAPDDLLRHFIYVSSTGVYGDFGGDWIDETAPTNPGREGGKACVEAETLLANSPFAERATILRFAGIYGPDRVPTRDTIETKKWHKLSAEGFLNLIHVDDGAAIVELISNQAEPAGELETYHVSDGSPSRRIDYYDFVAKQLGLGPIPWDEQEPPPPNSRASTSKRVSNRKLVERFAVTLNYPDFKSGLVQAMSYAK